jgi:hypothetical protein
MKLLISEDCVRRIENFARSVGARVECEALKIAISASQVSVIFFQPEQYSRLVNCEFKFSPDVSFFYEDILEAFAAISVSNAAHLAHGSESNADEMKRNDSYVLHVIDFCEEHWAEIIKVPPIWYEKAVEISDKSIRAIFPAIADEDFKKKIRLLEIWRGHPHE